MSAAGRRGSVKQATNGTWYFVVDLSDPGMPRRQTRRRGFASRRAAQAALTKVLRDLEQKTYVAPVRQTLAGFLVEEWLPAIRTTVRQSTYDSYARNVRLHVAQRWIGAVPLQEVDASKLNRLYADLLTGQQGRRPLAPRSVTYVHVILHRVFRDAICWDRLVRNPCESADPPKVTKRHRSTLRTWTAEELAAFLASTADDRLAAVWWLLATTGMRRGEVLGLTWSAVDLDAAVLAVRRTLVTTQPRRAGQPRMSWSEPKTAKGWRTVALDEDTVAVLRAHRRRQDDERLLVGRQGYDDQDLVCCLLTGGDPYQDAFVLLHPGDQAGWAPEDPPS